MEELESLYDQDGFLKDPSAWNHALAETIARREGIGNLDAERWLLIEELRGYHGIHDMVPMLRKACEEAKDLGLPCLYHAFDGDPVKAVKIAGLPKPVGEVIRLYRQTRCAECLKD